MVATEREDPRVKLWHLIVVTALALIGAVLILYLNSRLGAGMLT